jgi:hypothetical protein
MASSVKLFVHLDGALHPLLSIPITDFDRFTLRPLKWLRYLAYTVYGRQGKLFKDALGQCEVNYNLAILEDCYYFSSDSKPYFLVNLHLLSASYQTSRV